MPKFIDLTGQKFGRLEVLAKGEKNKWGNYKWLCRCACGKEKPIDSNNLKRGLTTSCGCYRDDRIKEVCGTHGETFKTPEYATWNNMKRRCDNANGSSYRDYGGRGITVCDRWINSYENFLEDMGRRPGEDMQIDRIDNNRGLFTRELPMGRS